MIEKKHKQEFFIIRITKSAPDAGGSTRPIQTTVGPLYGVVTRVNTSETLEFNSNVLERQKRIRTFSEVSVAYNDKVLLDGETWEIIGEPETVSSTMNTKKKSTVIMITKEGKN